MFRSSKELNFYAGILNCGVLGEESDDEDDNFQPSKNIPDSLDVGRIKIDYDVDFEGSRVHASRVLYLRYVSSSKQFQFFENIRNVTNPENLSEKEKRESGYHTLMNRIDLSKTKGGSYRCTDEDLRIEFNGVHFQQLAEEGIIGFVDKEKYGIVLSQLSFDNYLQILFILKRGVSKRVMKDLTRLLTRPFFYRNRICFWDTTSILEMSKLIYFDKFCTPDNNLFSLCKNDVLQSRMEGIDLCMDLIFQPAPDEKTRFLQPKQPDPEELAHRKRDIYMKFGLHRAGDDKKVRCFTNEVEREIRSSGGFFNGVEKIMIQKLATKIDQTKVSDSFVGIDPTCTEFRRFVDRKLIKNELTNLIIHGTREKPSHLKGGGTQVSDFHLNELHNQIFLSIERNDPQVVKKRMKNLRILKDMRVLDDDGKNNVSDEFSFSLLIGKNLRIRWTELSVVVYSEVLFGRDRDHEVDKPFYLIPLGQQQQQQQDDINQQQKQDTNNRRSVFQDQKLEELVDKITDTLVFWNSQHYFKKRFEKDQDPNDALKIRLDMNKRTRDEEGTQFVFIRDLLDCIFERRRKKTKNKKKNGVGVGMGSTSQQQQPFHLMKNLEDYFYFVFFNSLVPEEEKKEFITSPQLYISKSKSKDFYARFFTNNNEEEENEENDDMYVSLEICDYEKLEKSRFQILSSIKKSDFEVQYPLYNFLIEGRRNALFVESEFFSSSSNHRNEYNNDEEEQEGEEEEEEDDEDEDLKKYDREFDQYFRNFLGEKAYFEHKKRSGEKKKKKKSGQRHNQMMVMGNKNEILIDGRLKSILRGVYKKRRIVDIYRSSDKFLDENMKKIEKHLKDGKRKYYDDLEKLYIFDKNNNSKKQKKKKKKKKKSEEEEEDRLKRPRFKVDSFLVILQYVSEPETIYSLMLVCKKIRSMIERDVFRCCQYVTFSLKLSHEKLIDYHVNSGSEKKTNNNKKKKRKKVWKYVHRLHIGNSSRYGGTTFNRSKDLQIYLLHDLFPNLEHLRISENNVLRNSNLNHLQFLKSLSLFWCQGIDNPKSFRCLADKLTSLSFCEHSLMKFKSQTGEDVSGIINDEKRFGVNDSIFVYLGENLEQLKLARYHERFSSRGFKHLKKLRKIELSDSHLGNEIFRTLKSLEAIIVRNCENMTDRIFTKEMTQLKEIVVENCSLFKEIGFLKLAHATGLRRISIRGCKSMSVLRMERVVEKLEKSIGRKINFEMKY